MRMLIALATRFARGLYAAMKAVLPVRRKVVFLSRQSDEPSRDFTRLADALRSREPGLEIVMRCRTVGASFGDRVASSIAMIGQMYHLATSTACVIDGYVIPVSILDHRPDLFVVQMWHALGAIKRFGYQAVDRPGGRSSDIARSMRMHHNYDLVLCGGPATVPVFAEAFGVDSSIVAPLGLPRIDHLLETAQGCDPGGTSAGVALRARFPRLSDPTKQVVLYAPTHRAGGADRYRDVAQRFSGERYTLIIKPHPLERALIDEPSVVRAHDVDVLDLLPLCSAVITDYSAVAFEAAVIGVPVYFYVYDIDDYVRDLGLNIDPLDAWPQASSRDIGDLADRIDAGDTHPDLMRMLKERYACAPAGCADRIAQTILGSMRNP